MLLMSVEQTQTPYNHRSSNPLIYRSVGPWSLRYLGTWISLCEGDSRAAMCVQLKLPVPGWLLGNSGGEVYMSLTESNMCIQGTVGIRFVDNTLTACTEKSKSGNRIRRRRPMVLEFQTLCSLFVP